MFALVLVLLAPQAHAGELKPLSPHTARATSWHTADDGRFVGDHHPTFAVDDDRTTAWIEGAEGDGVGERLTIPLSRLESARRIQLKIRNGNQQSEKALEANPAPKKVQVRLFERGGNLATTESVTLERARGWQEIDIDVPDGKGFDAVSLEIRSVHTGRTSHAAITDVQVFVDSAVRHDPSLEERRRAELNEELKRLKDMGSYFGSIADLGPFAHEQFSATHHDLDVAKARRRFEGPHKGIERIEDRSERFDIVVNSPIELPGGAWEFEAVGDLFTPELLTIAETEREVAEREPPEDEPWVREYVKSTARIHFDKDKPEQPSRLHFTLRTVVEERGVWENESTYLLTYDGGGHMKMLYVQSESDGYQRESLTTFRVNDAGAITGWEVIDLSGTGSHASASRTVFSATAGT